MWCVFRGGISNRLIAAQVDSRSTVAPSQVAPHHPTPVLVPAREVREHLLLASCERKEGGSA